MVDFAFQNYAEYRLDVGGGDILIGTVTDTVGTITDRDGDNTFEAMDFDEDFPVGGVPTLITYIGTVEIGGKDYPVFSWVENVPAIGDFPVTTVYFDDAAAIPLTLDSNEINVNDVYPFCFGPETAIATPSGQTPAAALSIGDLVSTAEGRAVPVKWIGRQTILTSVLDLARRPVRIAAGALGGGFRSAI